ncbi:hypothetical protein Bca101_029204 [Brassica carinata]
MLRSPSVTNYWDRHGNIEFRDRTSYSHCFLRFSGASHLKFLPVNIQNSSYSCTNVAFDYQLFFRTISMGTKVKLPLALFYHQALSP